MRAIPCYYCERGTDRRKRGLVQQRQQGSAAGVVWASYRAGIMPCHRPIPSHPITSLSHAKEQASRPRTLTHLLVPTYTLPPYWAMLRRLFCPALPLRA